jgi:hypothetical protein
MHVTVHESFRSQNARQHIESGEAISRLPIDLREVSRDKGGERSANPAVNPANPDHLCDWTINRLDGMKGFIDTSSVYTGNPGNTLAVDFAEIAPMNLR